VTKAIAISLIFLLSGIGLEAQNRQRLIPPDGLYLRSGSLADQQPDVEWEMITGDWYIGAEDEYLRGWFFTRDSHQLVRPLVVCHQGVCFLLDPIRTDTNVLYYAPLLEVGPICVYKVERQYPVKIPVRAYNPVNGHPFMETTVERRTVSEQIMMWDPRTDEHAIMTSENYARWTGADTGTSLRVSDMLKGIRTYNLIFAQGGRQPIED